MSNKPLLWDSDFHVFGNSIFHFSAPGKVLKNLTDEMSLKARSCSIIEREFYTKKIFAFVQNH